MQETISSSVYLIKRVQKRYQVVRLNFFKNLTVILKLNEVVEVTRAFHLR